MEVQDADLWTFRAGPGEGSSLVLPEHPAEQLTSEEAAGAEADIRRANGGGHELLTRRASDRQLLGFASMLQEVKEQKLPNGWVTGQARGRRSEVPLLLTTAMRRRQQSLSRPWIVGFPREHSLGEHLLDENAQEDPRGLVMICMTWMACLLCVKRQLWQLRSKAQHGRHRGATWTASRHHMTASARMPACFGL